MACIEMGIVHMNNPELFMFKCAPRAEHQCVVAKCKWLQKCLDVMYRRALVKWSTAVRAHGSLASAASRRPPTDLLHVTPPVCPPSPPKTLAATLG